VRRNVQAVVEVEAIVDVDGSVRPVRVTKSLDEDLDIQALDAVKQWKFQPPLVDGTPAPVPCRVRIELTFVLRPS
jgi:periplasmic protein TonB